MSKGSSSKGIEDRSYPPENSQNRFGDFFGLDPSVRKKGKGFRACNVGPS